VNLDTPLPEDDRVRVQVATAIGKNADGAPNHDRQLAFRGDLRRSTFDSRADGEAFE
jgi:hypothetical protein